MDAWIAVMALVLGLARAAAPGPANTEALRRGAEADGGLRAAVLVQAGSLAGELGWAALAVVGLEMMLQDGTLRVLLAVAGGLLLLGLGIAALRYALTETGLPEIDPAARRPGAGAFGTGVSFNATSIAAPFLWLGVGSWLARVLPVGAGPGTTAGFLALFAAGWLGWAVALGLVSRRRATDAGAGAGRAPGGGPARGPGSGLVRAVDAAAGIALAAAGVVVLAGTAGIA